MVLKCLLMLMEMGKWTLIFLVYQKNNMVFSNNVIGLLGEPKFDKAFIEINDNKKTVILLR